MDAAAMLDRLTALGVTVTLRSNGNLYLEPASVIPLDLVDLVRQHKSAILAHLRYRKKYPGDVADDAELAEIERLVLEEGMCLTWCELVKDYVAFYLTEGDRAKVPPGFVPYSDAELWMLFGPERVVWSPKALWRIHAAKKTDADITGIRVNDDGTTMA